MEERIIARLEPLLTENRVRRMKAVLAARSDHVTFVFERMVDPHNLSAVLRTLDAFSFQDAHLIATQGQAALSRGITIGADRWLTLRDHADTEACLRALKEAGYRIYASLSAGGADSVSLDEMDFGVRTALVFGNEHAGVSGQVLDLADGAFTIPMRGFVESFNLSVAAALCAYRARTDMERLMREGAETPGGAAWDAGSWSMWLGGISTRCSN